MKNEEQRREAINTELYELRLHRASEPLRQLVRLLDALAEDTLADLARVAPDQLQRKQGALAQLAALRTAIAATGDHISPKA